MDKNKSKYKVRLPEPAGWYNKHVKRVYEDPDFLEEMAKLKRIVELFEAENRGHIFVGTRKAAPENIKNFIEEISDSFGIHWDNIILFFEYPGNPPINLKIITTRVNEIGKIIIEMDPELTKEEFEGFWPIVESEKNARIGKTRQRGTDNPELGYAIYRERKTKKLSFLSYK